MTILLYQTDSYLRSFEATIVELAEEDHGILAAGGYDRDCPLIMLHGLGGTHDFSSRKKSSSTRLSRRRAKTRASRAEGLYCPVSIELMVWRVTPTSEASCSWERFFSARATFRRLQRREFRITSTSHFLILAQHSPGVKYTCHFEMYT